MTLGENPKVVAVGSVLVGTTKQLLSTPCDTRTSGDVGTLSHMMIRFEYDMMLMML